MPKKRKRYGPKEPGQQYEEIVAARRKLGQNVIRSVQGSKSRDKQELQELAREALEKLRRRKLDQDDGATDEEARK